MSDLNPDYVFVLYKWTGEAICELPLTQVIYSNGLNGAGGLTANISLDAPEATNDNLQTLSREIGVWRDGVPEFVGPITRISPSIDAQGVVTASIACSSVWWYMTKRANELDLSYVSQDLADIIWDVLTVAQGLVPGGDVRIEQAPTYPVATGTVLTLNKKVFSYMSGISTDPVSTIVEKLGSQNPGFDFTIEYADAGQQTMHRYFNLYSPFKGVTVDQKITNDMSVSLFSMDEDGTNVYARAREVASFGIVYADDSAALTGGDIPMITGIESQPGVGRLTTLENYVAADLLLHKWPMRTYSVAYHPSKGLPYGFCTPGDSVVIDMTLGNLVYQKTLRTAEIAVDLTNGEEVAILFNNPAA